VQALENAKQRMVMRTALQADDHAAFFDALDHPLKPTAKLRAALQRHSRTIDSFQLSPSPLEGRG
jgi:uncharacterized protein (DUF1778 family)